MFLVGISGSFLPYLVLLGVVLIFSIRISTLQPDVVQDSEIHNPQKHLVYWSVPSAGDGSSNYFFSEYSERNNCRNQCGLEHDEDLKSSGFSWLLFDFDIFYPLKPYVVSKAIEDRLYSYRHSGLPPPLWQLM